MIGSFSYGWLSARMSKHRIVVLVMFAVTAAIIPMAFLPPLPVFVAAGFLLGLGWGPMNPLLNSLVQTRVPAHVQGRVYGVQTALFYAAPPLGLLLAGDRRRGMGRRSWCTPSSACCWSGSRC